MMKAVVLLALVAVAYAIPSPLVATPLLAKLSPQPEAPANTEHATHVAAALPIVQPITYAATVVAAPVVAAPLPYAAGYTVGAPIESHGYRIVY